MERQMKNCNLMRDHRGNCLQADLAASDAVKRIVTELERLDLKIDLLINNAGLGLTGDFLSHDLAQELASIQLNVQALVALSHALGAKMVSRGTGGIINLASNAAFQPLPIWRPRRQQRRSFSTSAKR
jgi:short-subunit dehydrogenase